MAKPKGYWDDIMKAARKAAAAGNDKVAKDLRRKADMVAEDALRAQRGLKRNIKEWDSRIGRFDYSVADEQQAKTVSARLREQARQRGLKAKSQKIGKKEQADVKQSLMQAAKRDDMAKARKAAGGRNNPNAVKARQKKAANARNAAKPKPAAGGAGKGPKNPKKTGTASAPKGPKKPKA
jgi:gamma-glutamylcysteine synthetase